jgi:hypothetical protein
MATNITSTSVSNLTAQPSIIGNSGQNGGAGHLIEQQVTIPIATANLSINSLWYVMPLPWTAKLSSLKFISDVALDNNATNGLTFDIGLYTVSPDGVTYTAQAATVYASNLALSGNQAAINNDLLVSGARAFTKAGQEVFLDAGATYSYNDLNSGNGVSPNYAVLVAKVHTAASTAQAGNLIVKATYIA